MVLKTSVTSLIFCALLAICSCDHELKQALNMSGSNKPELEKVLDHFRNDSNPLKYNAAKFLIENMAYHYTYSGDAMDVYDSAYIRMSMQPLQFRDSVFKSYVIGNDIYGEKPKIDLTSVSAKFLIRAIDDACDIWYNSSWSKDYDTSLFFDYVLPYRLLNEPLSDWRTLICNEYPELNDGMIYSKRGVIYEAETAQCNTVDIVATESASCGKMVTLNCPKKKVTFSVASPSAAQKKLFLRYTSVESNTRIVIHLNGSIVDTLNLLPANTLKAFRDSKTGCDITLLKGLNTLTVEATNDIVGLDYISLAAKEPFNREKITDFSDTYCRIKNCSNLHYITFDTLQASLLNMLELKPELPNDSTQLLRLNYLGYPCWSINAFKSDTIDLCMEVQYCRTELGSPITQYSYLNGNHQKWILMSIGNGQYKIMSKDSGLFLESVRDNDTDRDTLVLNPYEGRTSQKWIIERGGKRKDDPPMFKVGSAISEALRIFDVTNQFEWFAFSGNIPPKASSLCLCRTGNCRDEASYVVYLCRYLGIPAAIDFTPNWGNRSQSHSWSVLIKPDGKSIPFYMGCAPGDTVHYYHSYLKPKIFRHRFQLNREFQKDLSKEETVPDLFRFPDYIDVTDEYYTTADVVRSIPPTEKDHNVAYICVFDNRKWVPVYYGNIKDGCVTFKSMGRNIMYMAAFYEDGNIKPFGNPFILQSDGKVRDIITVPNKTQTMKLLRKYPFMGKEDYFNIRMSGGRFQGANTKDFSDATDLYTHEGLTNGNWYEIPINDNGKYQYLRYIGPNGSHCNINELVFYDYKGDKVEGEIIGTEGEQGQTIDKVFDGDILTGFNAVSPDGHWVGLKARYPTCVGKIRYIPRNDGNGIEIGDKYELYYWHDNQWTILATHTARHNNLVIENIPCGGLYVLRDVTKGHEERIFTYENNTQIWW